MALPPLPDPDYDFEGATFDLRDPRDRELVRFILSQALYGEATGVYCGKSLYAAVSLEAAQFYVRQARQELAHLVLFADIFRALEMQPLPGHWVVRLLSSHNNYYPLKVLMEHALGEGMVLDIFKDVLLQTLPDDHPAVPEIKKKLRVVCREEIEHVEWGEKETRRLLAGRPWLRTPYYGLLELQLEVAPWLVRAFERRAAGHPVGSLGGGEKSVGAYGVEPLSQRLGGPVGVLARRGADDARRLLVHALMHQHLEPHLQPAPAPVKNISPGEEY